AGGVKSDREGGGGWGGGREGGEGEGARPQRVPADAGRPDRLHLLPPRRGQAAHQGAPRPQGHGGRLRDHPDRRRPASPAQADERGRREDGGAGGRGPTREGPRRQGRAPLGRARRGPRPGGGRGKVVILGGGKVGTNSAKLASGMGADTVVLDVSAGRLAYLDDIFGSRITPIYSDPAQVAKYVREADVVIGGVLIPGAKAPKLVSEKLISEMQEGSVVVDVAVDQGGCIETCHPTTHDNPTYTVH